MLDVLHTHGVAKPDIRLHRELAHLRQQVLAVPRILVKPCLVIDAGNLPIDFFERHIEALGPLMGKVLHRVAEPDELDARGQPVHAPAEHRHRVGVVEQDRVRAQFHDVLRDASLVRQRAQAAHDASRRKGVADALVYTVLHRDIDFRMYRVVAADQQTGDDVVGTGQGLTAVGRHCAGGVVVAAFLENPLRYPARVLEALLVDIDEREFSVTGGFVGQNVRSEPAEETQATRSDEGYFRHVNSRREELRL